MSQYKTIYHCSIVRVEALSSPTDVFPSVFFTSAAAADRFMYYERDKIAPNTWWKTIKFHPAFDTVEVVTEEGHFVSTIQTITADGLK